MARVGARKSLVINGYYVNIVHTEDTGDRSLFTIELLACSDEPASCYLYAIEPHETFVTVGELSCASFDDSLVDDLSLLFGDYYEGAAVGVQVAAKWSRPEAYMEF